VFTAELPSSPVTLCQNQGFSTTVKVLVRATESPGASACSLIAWSRIPGVEVSWGTGGHEQIAASSIDKVVYVGSGMLEYSLFILNTSGDPPEGAIEIRYTNRDIQSLEDTPILGIVDVKRRTPRLCSVIDIPSSSPAALAILGLVLGIAGVLFLRFRSGAIL
jgi:hypothetical protein